MHCIFCLKIATALRHTQTNKQTNTYIVYLKNKNKNNLLKKHIGTSSQNLLALNVKDQGFSPSPIKIDFKIGIRWFLQH
jgi:hypothetical protein